MDGREVVRGLMEQENVAVVSRGDAIADDDDDDEDLHCLEL